MGCGASSLRGDDVPSINANAKPSYMRSLSTPKSPAPQEHYETAQEHEAELQRVQSSQQQRRASRPAYVDPDDLPMPPKTTHQHYHRRPSDNQMEKPTEGWKERVKKVRSDVMIPGDRKGMNANAGLTQEEMRERGHPSRGSSGVIVPNGTRHRSFIG